MMFILAFIAFLFIGMGATVFREKQTTSYYENRTLAVMPEYTRAGILDGSYFSGVDKYLQDHAAGRESIIRLNTAIDLKVLKRPVVNTIVINDDVLLPYLEYESVDEDAVSAKAQKIADRLTEHKKQCEEYGAEFIYVAVPCQYVIFEDSYPPYMNNRKGYTEITSKTLFKKLDENGVGYIDMLPVFRELGDYYKYSSSCDNHFSIFGAYETYREIMERVNKLGYSLDILGDGDYTVNEVPNPYLGSRERKLCDLMTMGAHLYTIEPNVSIPYDRYNYSNKTASSVYSIPANVYEKAAYTMYMGGDISNTTIDTHREQLPDILIYGDSFTNAVESIIWYNFDKMDSLDFRHYKEMTLSDFIEKNKPDIVVCIRDYEALLQTECNGQ